MSDGAGPRPVGVVLDLDGTVYGARGLVPGASAAIAVLRAADIPLCFATNTTRRPRRAIVEHLRALGIEVRPEEVLTAPVAAVSLLRARRVRTLSLHVSATTEVEFSEFGRDAEAPDAVVVGDLGDGWSFARLNRAFRQLMAGADLVALQKNRYWRTDDDGLTLDAGPFVAALEYGSGREALVVGKPADRFFGAACEVLGLPRSQVVMVGDDVESDVGGAIRAGLRGVLVRTGKFRPADLAHGVEPHGVIDSVADLPTWIGVVSGSSGTSE